MEKDSKLQRVVCLNSGEVYRSISAAAAAAGVSASSIMRAIKSDRVCCGKFYALLPKEITSEQLDHWRMSRLLGCISFRLGGDGSACDSELRTAEN